MVTYTKEYEHYFEIYPGTSFNKNLKRMRMLDLRKQKNK